MDSPLDDPANFTCPLSDAKRFIVECTAESDYRVLHCEIGTIAGLVVVRMATNDPETNKQEVVLTEEMIRHIVERYGK